MNASIPPKPSRPSRRTFVIACAGALPALALGLQSSARAADLPMLAETDPVAQGLGYKANAAHVDKAKFPRYQAGQDCTNCSFYQGKPTDAAALCPLFAGKRVAGKGWCNSYSKRA